MQQNQGQDAISERRRIEYGGINLKRQTFLPPFGHLNFLAQVIEDDNEALMRVRGEPMIPGDMFFVLNLKWNFIEQMAAAQGYDIFIALREMPDMLMDSIQQFRRDLARLEAALLYWQRTNHERPLYAPEVPALYERDYAELIVRDQEYNASWKKRGGVGAFMMLARKWDRFAPMVEQFDSIPLTMLKAKPDRVDDVTDLRRYLMLVTSERLYRVAVET